MSCKHFHADANIEISRNDPISGKNFRIMNSEFCILNSEFSFVRLFSLP
jgi:hypothetical protein